jgi:hypothetical protein
MTDFFTIDRKHQRVVHEEPANLTVCLSMKWPGQGRSEREWALNLKGACADA